MRNVVVLGSTGSVGKTALEAVRSFPDRFRVVGLSAHSSIEELAAQARSFDVRRVTTSRNDCLPGLRALLSGTSCEVIPFADATDRMIADPGTDVVLLAIVGVAGLPSALAAIRAGKTLAVANKEPLAAAGSLLMAEARARGAIVVPVDSEHSAVFQALRAGRPGEVRSIILTASGGPFRTRPVASFADVTPAEALRHPTWRMGPKITVDSATMMNKALEVIEAVHLFDVPPDRVRVLIHPQSIVHSMVEFCDGAIIAQLGRADMRLPILHALSHPERLPFEDARLDLATLRDLTFEAADPARYPALELGYRAARAGGVAGAVLNAANEAAVAAFLEGRIPFPEITVLVTHALSVHTPREAPVLEDILAADRWARSEVTRCLN
ncbi:MAG: 1-deoxy-D-xylulose-5-phosphate reductoisomerase [Planctomycetes bacterium]|jgi:1-deoxy-D-xylulose-5-phosphate reductoisomerase|nr:1-deoxy-D-xylulose-5-phosphate reductoisomerase [Planctomycetota bacterium]